MSTRDPHRFINELDESIIESLINRLESRAKDKVFVQLLDNYISGLQLPSSANILEIGCGTGAVIRRIAQGKKFSGKALGVDQCHAFIASAKRFSEDENLSEKVEFKIGDAHKLEFASSSFDVVIAHTLISHVTNPQMVIQEMARVARPGGIIVIFDGDYASLTYAYPDFEFGRKMDLALVNATFNNPVIMRELPRILTECGLELKEAWGDAVVEIGKASYFRSFAETYAPFVIKAGTLPANVVESWLAEQRHAMDDRTFFASCNYYTYMARRAD